MNSTVNLTEDEVIWWYSLNFLIKMYPVEMFSLHSLQRLVMTKTLVQIFVDILAQPHLTPHVSIFNAAPICCRNCVIDHLWISDFRTSLSSEREKKSSILAVLGTRDLSHHLMKPCIIKSLIDFGDRMCTKGLSDKFDSASKHALLDKLGLLNPPVT